MRRIHKYSVLVVLMGILALTTVPAYATKSGLKDAKDKKTAIEQEKQKVQSTLKNLESLKSDTESYVRELDRSLASVNQELEELEVQLADTNTRIADSTERLHAAENTMAEQYEAMKLRIRYMYEKGEVSYLDLLFQSRNLEELLNRAEYVTQISRYDREMLDAYILTKEQIAAEKEELETGQAELLALQEMTEAKQQSVEELLNSKTKELNSYAAQIASAEGQINVFNNELKAQEAKIASIEAEIKRKEEEARKAAEAAKKTYSTQTLGNISFTWPVPASGRITSSFGKRSQPKKGASTNHQGIDIGAGTGTAIVASAAGEVVISTYSSSAGNYIMINHGSGIYTVYMHCSKLLVGVGAKVKKGQTIAKVGSTGNSTGPHLHFGIRSGGSYVNPSKYVHP